MHRNYTIIIRRSIGIEQKHFLNFLTKIYSVTKIDVSMACFDPSPPQKSASPVSPSYNTVTGLRCHSHQKRLIQWFELYPSVYVYRHSASASFLQFSSIALK